MWRIIDNCYLITKIDGFHHTKVLRLQTVSTRHLHFVPLLKLLRNTGLHTTYYISALHNSRIKPFLSITMVSFQGALIDGKWSGGEGCSGKKDIAVLNPGTGETIGTVSACEKKDADLALVAAERAFPAWSKLGIDGRAKHILAFRYYQK